MTLGKYSIANRTENDAVSIDTLGLFFLSQIYLMSLSYGYYYLSNCYYEGWFPLEPNMMKLLYGLICCTIIYFSINHDKKKVSGLLLEAIYYFQIIPITVVFWMKNENFLVYTIICIGMLLCEVIVACKSGANEINFKTKFDYWKYVLWGMVIIFMLYRLLKYGIPSLSALNLYSVYDLRRSGIYDLSKYWGYLQSIIINVCIPVLLTRCYIKKSWFGVLAILLVDIIIYLYAGHKTFLFVGPMVLCILLLSRMEGFPKTLWSWFMLGTSIFSFMGRFRKFDSIYDLLVRRVLIVPANLKFVYNEFFENHPKVGFAGIFPRWLINVSNPYGSGPYKGYAYLIGEEYFNRPEMSCDSGFIAEGILRWGIWGILIEFAVLALIFKLIDSFANKCGYVFGSGCAFFFAYSLSENHLIDQCFFGYTMVFLLFILSYRSKTATTKRRTYVLNEYCFRAISLKGGRDKWN